VPIYYNHANTGRPAGTEKYTSKYIDLPNGPLLPFGFGLSYTTFTLSDLHLSATEIAPTGSVQATVTVTNTGQRAGDEVVQLYVQDVAGRFTRPVRALTGFSRVTLEPGASRTLTFTLDKAALGVLHDDGPVVVEPGAFKVWASTSSEGGLEGSFTVKQVNAKR
jgi:beta-glucosidase